MEWLATPAGRLAQAWGQARLDAAVADLFGFHALQLGRPGLDGLRANRMPHRWHLAEAPPADGDAGPRPCLVGDFTALPFATHSLDLVVMPFTLEGSADPHATLREVARVLRPEGRVVVLGFNPASLWGLRQAGGGLACRLGAHGDLYRPPLASPALQPGRLRDWLRLLAFEVEAGGFGCYRPPWRSEAWLRRWAWMEPAGDRWWPMFGALQLLVAVKRVRGLRLINPAWKARPRPRAAPAVAAPRRQNPPRLGRGAAPPPAA